MTEADLKNRISEILHWHEECADEEDCGFKDKIEELVELFNEVTKT